jgi:Photoprotection regulator fluorescence recovery protein
MQVTEIDWTETEQEIAQQAFDRAYERETKALVEHIRQGVSEVKRLDDIWSLHDFLSARRHDLDGKYDYRFSVLIFVFASLLKEGWLSLDDLNGLTVDKIAKIKSLALM